MTFCAEVSVSVGGSVVVSRAVSSPATVGGVSGGRESADFAGDAGGVSSEARIREIGGKTARFDLGSPSSAFLLGLFRSMRETLSASRLEDRAVSGAGFESGGVFGFTAGATSFDFSRLYPSVRLAFHWMKSGRR